MKIVVCLLSIFIFAFQLSAQTPDCTFTRPHITIHFGTGNVRDINTASLSYYSRVSGYCPTDGHYVFASSTSDCFHGDWHTLDEDHTPGDKGGNMLLVNAAPNSGVFLNTLINGLKAGATYELGVWLMNLCRPTDKCPYPLLPKLTVRLETEDGKKIAQFVSGELPRVETPHWARHNAIFTAPTTMTGLRLIMIDNAPGGCGNDFALDDITFRECIIPPPVTKANQITPTKPTVVKKQPATVKVPPKKSPTRTVSKDGLVSQFTKPKTGAISKKTENVLPPPPLVLTTRENELVKKIEMEAGEIRIALYDNGEIDGDTVSIYHNNSLIRSQARLSDKPISFSIALDVLQPHHEVVMVADNLGSIPPNTSVMIITAGSRRHQVFISSSAQKNAKVILDLKK